MNLARDFFASMITTPLLRRQINLVATTFAVGLLIVAFRTDEGLTFDHLSPESSAVASEGSNATLSALHHRKLLHRATGVVEPRRIWGEKCSKSDIVITQGPTAPLPNGIPTYTVEIVNACVTGCDISGIHLSCGWFSSARLINPRIFKRLRYGDCLVNDGQPLVNGRAISFQYANTFLYPLSVSSLIC